MKISAKLFTLVSIEILHQRKHTGLTLQTVSYDFMQKFGLYICHSARKIKILSLVKLPVSSCKIFAFELKAKSMEFSLTDDDSTLWDPVIT